MGISILPNENLDLFPLSPFPQFSGCILFAPPDARAISLHNDLQCSGTCYVTGEAQRTGGHKREKQIFFGVGVFCVKCIVCVGLYVFVPIYEVSIGMSEWQHFFKKT